MMRSLGEATRGTFERLPEHRETTLGKRTLFLLRSLVFLAAGVFLFVRFSDDRQHDEALLEWYRHTEVPWMVLALVCGLMFLNWGIEAFKWQLLLRDVEPLGWMRAFTAVIAGTSIGLVTPNRVGEFAGRVLFLRPVHRVQGSFATLLGSIAQFVVTVLGGTLLLFTTSLAPEGAIDAPVWDLVKWSALLIGVGTVFLYFSPAALERIFLAVPFLRRYERHVHVLAVFDRPRLVRVLASSALRYMVFTCQFALLLVHIAGVPWMNAFTAIPLIFLVTTLVPTTALTELGVRGSVAEALVTGGEPTGVVIASIIVWVVNIVLPAVAGSLILLVSRIRSVEDPE
jgi:hypothetical protein